MRNEHVKAIVSAMLKHTLCHLQSYLLGFFLSQLQVGDWYTSPPYRASPQVATQWHGNAPTAALQIKLLRLEPHTAKALIGVMRRQNNRDSLWISLPHNEMKPSEPRVCSSAQRVCSR